MNITQISHLLINMFVKCVFNAQYQSVKYTNYKWTNFAQFPLLNYEMLSLWCRFENVGCKRSKQLEIIFQVMISCELGQDIFLCWWLQMWFKWGMIYLFIDGYRTSEWNYSCHLNNKHFAWIDAMHVRNLGKLDNVFIFFTKEINVKRNFEL
jgi:hypothetical protein